MYTLFYLVKRNCKVYFKDKGMFFTSLITPLILLVLYATFLAKVFKDSMLMNIPEGIEVEESLINATVGGELVSSLLAVSCVTVAFCTNLLMVKDKAENIRRDITITPVSKPIIALSYFLGSLIATLIVCYVATFVCLIYLAVVGWYLSFVDILIIFLDVFLLALFGTSLSSLVNCFLSSNGQASAVGTIVSSGYGFICGAYMPLSNFHESLQKVLSFLPGTYGTSIIRNACLNPVFEEMENQHFPSESIEGIKKSIDCNLYFFGNKVDLPIMYLILCGSTILIIGIYILINVLQKKSK